jgi:large subunit ribosomal protein L20
MARTTAGKVTKQRHKKILKLAKGYRGRAKNCYRIAIEKVEKALQYAYRDRKARKRDFRGLWIQRINAAVREHGIIYSQFISGLKKASIEIDRKVLSDLAIHDSEAFKHIVEQAKAAM